MWHKKTKNAIKIASLNCAGLKPHSLDIIDDTTLLNADILHLLETSLEKTDDILLTIPGYNSHFINVGNGKGIVTFYKEEVFKHQQDHEGENMQITKFTSDELDVINVYRSSNGHSVELLSHLKDMMTKEKSLLITGDFNICFHTISNNRMSKGLDKLGFSQLVKEATHIRGGHIDHAYWRDENGVWKNPELERYSPYYSDHDASCITLVRRE